MGKRIKARLLAEKELVCGLLFACAYTSMFGLMFVGLFTDVGSSTSPVLPLLLMASFCAVVFTSCLLMWVMEDDGHE